jgi:hypothetical protein
MRSLSVNSRHHAVPAGTGGMAGWKNREEKRVVEIYLSTAALDP